MSDIVYHSDNLKISFKIIDNKLALLDSKGEITCYLSLHNALDMNILTQQKIEDLGLKLL